MLILYSCNLFHSMIILTIITKLAGAPMTRKKIDIEKAGIVSLDPILFGTKRKI